MWKCSSLYKAETVYAGRLKVIFLMNEFEPTYIMLFLICGKLPKRPKTVNKHPNLLYFYFCLVLLHVPNILCRSIFLWQSKNFFTYCSSPKYFEKDNGGFHMVAKIIMELKSHMIPYEFKCSHWLKLQHSDSKAIFHQWELLNL